MSKFCDFTIIKIKAGHGGNGASHFRHEKFIDHGGPDGGDGGRGGNILFIANPNENTLINFHTKKHFNAENGGNGGKSLRHGANGEDLILKVPVGTIIYDSNTEKILADLKTSTSSAIIAQGGRGGLGNAYFKSSTNQAPRLAENGEPGDCKEIKLELKFVAQVGIIGFPSAGKSTLISKISNAKPKIASYPFTTLIPNLGVVSLTKFDKHNHFSFTITDIPGLIEGASQGKGLGFQFLRHISRNHILIHLIDATSENPLETYKIVRKELEQFNPELLTKDEIVVLNKIDMITEDELEKLLKKFTNKKLIIKKNLFAISALTGTNLSKLVFNLEQRVKNLPHEIQITDIRDAIELSHKLSTNFDIKFIRKKIDREVNKERRVWEISCDRLIQLLNMTNIEDHEGYERIYHFIKRIGIQKELFKKGAQPGDRLRIGEHNIIMRQ